MLVFLRSVNGAAPEATFQAKTWLLSAEYRQDKQPTSTEEGLKGAAIRLGLFSNQGDKMRTGLREPGDEKEGRPHLRPSDSRAAGRVRGQHSRTNSWLIHWKHHSQMKYPPRQLLHKRSQLQYGSSESSYIFESSQWWFNSDILKCPSSAMTLCLIWWKSYFHTYIKKIGIPLSKAGQYGWINITIEKTASPTRSNWWLFWCFQSSDQLDILYVESGNYALHIKRITNGLSKKTNVPTTNMWSPEVTLYPAVRNALPPKTTCSSNTGAAKLNIYGRWKDRAAFQHLLC